MINILESKLASYFILRKSGHFNNECVEITGKNIEFSISLFLVFYFFRLIYKNQQVMKEESIKQDNIKEYRH